MAKYEKSWWNDIHTRVIIMHPLYKLVAIIWRHMWSSGVSWCRHVWGHGIDSWPGQCILAFRCLGVRVFVGSLLFPIFQSTSALVTWRPEERMWYCILFNYIFKYYSFNISIRIVNCLPNNIKRLNWPVFKSLLAKMAFNT